MIHSCLWLRLFPPPLGAPAAPHKDTIEEHGQYCKAQGLMYLIISPSVLRFAHVCIEFERFFRLFGWSYFRKKQTKKLYTHTHHLLEEPKQTLWPFHPLFGGHDSPFSRVKFSLSVPILCDLFSVMVSSRDPFQRLERWPLIDRGSFLSLCLNHHRCVFFIGKNAGTLGMCVFLGYQHFPYDIWNVSFLSFVTLYGSSLVKIRLMTSVRMK